MIEATIAFVFGLLIGSFLNVCIHRWPRNRSVVKPRSHCTRCRTLIKWYDNIPVVSYIVLGGRCRKCGKAISYRYPVVELMTAGLFAIIFGKLGLTLAAVKYAIFAAMLTALIFTDIEKRILPDEFTLGGLMVGLVLSPFVEVKDFSAHAVLLLAGFHMSDAWMSVAESIAGAIIPAGMLWLCGWAMGRLKRYRDMDVLGLGDVKMVAMIGSFLGIGGTLLAAILGSMAGSIIGVIYILVTKKDWHSYPLPFGSFLAAAAIVAALAGSQVFQWYNPLS
jgi:leader peptidase (prepilin peptidase)/N-methyltransferase